MWLARAWPWAWRVRLDLILLLNLAMALLCLALARIVAPAIIARTSDFLPDGASTLLLAAGAIAGLCCAIVWAFAVSRSQRLRRSARYGGEPGLLLASLVFLSFVFWMIAAAASPHVNLLRNPVTGAPIEVTISSRLDDRWEGAPPYARITASFTGFAAREAPSASACAARGRSERHAYLCALARHARTADLWRSLSVRPPPDWRSAGVDAYVRNDAPPRRGRALSLALGEAVIGFASETEPWKSRLEAQPSWERPWDVLIDPELAPAFARSEHFERFVAFDMLFGRTGANLPQELFDDAPKNRPHSLREPWWYLLGEPWRNWQQGTLSRLATTPAFTEAWSDAGDKRGAHPELVLRALVRDGAYGAQLREMKPYAPLAAHWRRILAEAPRAPEEALASELWALKNVSLLGLAAACVLAVFLAALKATDLGLTLGAFAVHAAAFATAFGVAAGLAGFLRITDDQFWVSYVGGVSACAMLAPLAMIVVPLARGVRGRMTAFFTACSIWAPLLWLPPAAITFLGFWRLRWDWVARWADAWPLATAVVVMVFASLVHVLTARVGRLPLTR